MSKFSDDIRKRELIRVIQQSFNFYLNLTAEERFSLMTEDHNGHWRDDPRAVKSAVLQRHAYIEYLHFNLSESLTLTRDEQRLADMIIYHHACMLQRIDHYPLVKP